VTSLAPLLRTHKSTILSEWSRRVREAPDVPIARRLSVPALVDNLPDLIDDLIGCLASSDMKAVADRIVCGRQLGQTRAAEAHAAHRSAEGYSMRQALLELSMFRMVFLEVIDREGGAISLEEMMIAHAAIDEAMRTCAAEMEEVNVAAALGESNARKEILRVVSHDLRNPLSTILVTAERLHHSSDEVTVHKAEVIARNADRIRRLIDDLADVNAMESGSLSVTPATEPLRPLLHHAVSNLREVAEKKAIELAVGDIPDLTVMADAQRLDQVLGNLLSNAFAVLTRGGHVWLNAERHGEEAIVSVRDDGPGIDVQNQSLVFDRFWRAPDARYAGTGLGLALSRGIVEALGGRIWVDSEPGKGATFYFSLLISPLS
jgi:signal transduction histidine kinase